jgi:hypothetical protein
MRSLMRGVEEVVIWVWRSTSVSISKFESLEVNRTVTVN